MYQQIINPILFSLCLSIFIVSCSNLPKPMVEEKAQEKEIMEGKTIEQLNQKDLATPHVHQFPLDDKTPDGSYKAVGLEKKKPVKRNYNKRYRSHPSLRLTQ